MKKNILVKLLLVAPLIFTASIACATNNNIKVVNAADGYVEFMFNGVCGGRTITIEKNGDSSIYTTNDCDDNDNIMIHGQHIYLPPGGSYCNNGQHYNADKISSVTIYASGSCDVICTDGSTSSCKIQDF